MIRKHNCLEVCPARTSSKTRQFTYVDLFAGAGGLSEGFVRRGFLPIAHVEQDSNACLTLKTRISYQHLKQTDQLDIYRSYLRKKILRESLYKAVPEDLLESVINQRIARSTLNEIFGEIEYLREDRPVDVVIGGPPCQAYSVIGRVAHSNGTRWDARKFLYKLYAEFLQRFRPKVFVFENVPGLHSAGEGRYYEKMIELFDQIGYETEDHILDAIEFGVVQHRRRIILVGWRKDFDGHYPEFPRVPNPWTVSDLLEDLPAIRQGESMDPARYTARPSKYLSSHHIRNGFSFTTQHIARPHNKKDLLIYRLAIRKWLSEGKNLKNNQIPSSLRTQNNNSSFLDRFKVVRSNVPSHTMIAHIAKDGHHFIHPDERQLRSISVREAARIQSFPDDFFFEGSRSAAFTQIGNAVPPLMAEAIAMGIKQLLSCR